MSLEIEHKYLVKNSTFREMATRSYRIVQGYLSRDPERTVRIRIKGDQGFITVKGKSEGAIRHEFEYEIPLKDAELMMSLCIPPILEKIRYIVPFEGHCWEIDEFEGNRKGLVLAEIELESNDETYEKPDFICDDVTGDPRYYNSNL